MLTFDLAVAAEHRRSTSRSVGLVEVKDMYTSREAHVFDMRLEHIHDGLLVLVERARLL